MSRTEKTVQPCAVFLRLMQKGGKMKSEKIASENEVLEFLTEIMRDSEDEKTQMKASELLAKYLGMNEKTAAEKKTVRIIDDIE